MFTGSKRLVNDMSDNDKAVNEVKSGSVYRSPGIYLMAEEKPQKSSARPSEKTV